MTHKTIDLNMPPAIPYTLNTPAGEMTISAVLRHLPSKRLVVRATHDQPVLLKLLANNRQGHRQLQREQRGYERMQTTGLPMPECVFVTDNFEGLLAVAYGWLRDATALTERELFNPPVCNQLLRQIATLHQHGLIHTDLHVDNLLLSHGELYVVDYAAVQRQSTAHLDKKNSLANLAVLIAQFTDAGQQYLLEQAENYFQARGWTNTSSLQSQLSRYVDKAWHKRHQNVIQKCFRPCTMTAFRRTPHQRWAMRRDFYDQTGELTPEQLDALIDAGEILKAGNSATVAKTLMAGQTVVIKRYNIKSWVHWLKRCWRPSRAANAWRQARTLELIGISTPRALGFVEKRHWGLWGRAYLITAFTPAPSLAELTSINSYRPELNNLLGLFKKYRLSHGDMKASNLLINESGQITVIDLDAMRMHVTGSSFKAAFAKDEKRLWANDFDVF